MRSTLSVVESDSRTVTGRNLRSILQLCDKSTVQQLCPSDMDRVLYRGEPQPDQWRIVAILEALKVRAGEMDLPKGWVREEFKEILEVACVN